MTTNIQTAARALMEAAERARRDALVNLEAERIDCRALIRKYDKARERLARLDAEYARVEAQKIEDIARQALERAQKCDGDHIGPLCADKQCWLRDPPEEDEEKPTLLDLTKLPPGTVCEATNFFPIYNSGKMMHTTDRFRTQRVASGELPVLAVVGEDLWWFPALVPARVVKEGGEDGQG